MQFIQTGRQSDNQLLWTTQYILNVHITYTHWIHRDKDSVRAKKTERHSFNVLQSWWEIIICDLWCFMHFLVQNIKKKNTYLLGVHPHHHYCHINVWTTTEAIFCSLLIAQEKLRTMKGKRYEWKLYSRNIYVWCVGLLVLSCFFFLDGDRRWVKGDRKIKEINMVRKTRSHIHLKRLFEDVVWDKQFSFIVCSIVPLLHAKWQMHYSPLWLLVFGVWYLILLNSECVTFHFSLFYSLFLFRYSTTWYSCKCVYCMCMRLHHLFFIFFLLVFAHVLLLIHPSIHPVLCLNNFSFRIRVSCLLSVSFYCGYCVMFSKQNLTISISRVFEYSCVHAHCLFQSIFCRVLRLLFIFLEKRFTYISTFGLRFGRISYLSYDLFIVFPPHLALAFHCML